MIESLFENIFLPELLPPDALPIMVQTVGEDTEQETIHRQNGFPAFHAMLSMDGTGILIAGKKSVDVPPGHVFLIAPDQPHSYYSKFEQWHTCWVVFYGSEAHEIVSRLNLVKEKPFPLSDMKLFRQYYDQIRACALDNSLKGIYEASALCYALLAALSFEVHNQTGNLLLRDTERRLAPVLQFIHDSYTNDIGLDQMAECIGITPQHLCKLFKATLAMTPHEYLQQYRLKKAKELLLDKKLPSRKVGSLCGFHDPSHFCAIFKKQTGHTPKEFRELYGGMSD